MIVDDLVKVATGQPGMRATLEASDSVNVAMVSGVHPVRSYSGDAQGGINAALGDGHG